MATDERLSGVLCELMGMWSIVRKVIATFPIHNLAVCFTSIVLLLKNRSAFGVRVLLTILLRAPSHWTYVAPGADDMVEYCAPGVVVAYCAPDDTYSVPAAGAPVTALVTSVVVVAGA